jgi:hypothetical protein
MCNIGISLWGGTRDLNFKEINGTQNLYLAQNGTHKIQSENHCPKETQHIWMNIWLYIKTEKNSSNV